MRKPCAILTLISMLFSMPFAAPIARADDHLVARGAVNQRLADAATERARNLASLEGLLASPRAGKAAAIAGVDLDRVRRSLPQLSDTDLRDLSQRAAALKSNPVAAGHYHGEAEDVLVFVILISAVALVVLAVADRY